MGSFLYNLKGQVTVLNLLVLFLIVVFVLDRYKKRKAALFLLSVSIILFLLCSTAYLPDYMADKLERTYPPYQVNANSSDTSRVLIIVLGSGYTLDKRLPATAQIGWCALGRLAEGIRVYCSLKNSMLICSGYSALGLETQAQITRRAAIILGVDSTHLDTLNTPSTTQEEATALRIHYDKASRLIIVTDAIHMPRAMRIFKAQGFNPVAAPTNYKVNEGPVQDGMKWWPSFDRIGLMNYVIHEWFGGLKASLES